MTDDELLMRQARLIAEGLQIEKRIHTLAAELNMLARHHQRFADFIPRVTANVTKQNSSFTPLSDYLKELHQALPPHSEVQRLVDELVAESGRLDQLRADCAKF